MNRFTRRSIVVALAATAAAFASPAGADRKVKVVATFTILGDMVKNVGGALVEVSTLVGPDGDAHVFEPSPADARALAGADLVFVNGLDFEGWIDRLVKVSGYRGPVVVASSGISPLKAGHVDGPGPGQMGSNGDRQDGAKDPHAWQDLRNGAVYVANIAAALVAADPPRAETYRRQAAAYGRELAALDRDIRARLAAVPEDRRKVITSHDAFQYFGRAYGIAFRAPIGLSTESEPSAREIAALVRQMKAEGIRALFVENISDPRLMQQLAREAGAFIGGALYSDSLSGPNGPASTYLDMFRHNASEIAKALTG